MNNVNMSDIASKIHFIYKDECEKNIAAMVIFHNNGKYFFDEKHENEMTNDEVEALLLRGALIYKDGKYVKPSSFDDQKVSLSDAIIDPGDIEVDLSGYATKEYVHDEVNTNMIEIKDILGFVENTVETLSFGINTQSVASSIKVDIRQGDNLYFEFLSYDGQKLKNIQVFLYRDDSNYDTLTKLNNSSKFLPGESIEFEALNDYVKIKFYVNVTEKESANVVVNFGGLKYNKSGILQRVENLESKVGISKGINLLILGDSYSEQKKWVAELYNYIDINNIINLGTSSATLKDRQSDRTLYPYSDRQNKSDGTGNGNTLASQVEWLKRLITGTDLDEGENQITEDEYPNIILIEGGKNDVKDAYDIDYLNILYESISDIHVIKANGTGAASGKNIFKPIDVEIINRTTFAGSLKHLAYELHTLFPKAIILCIAPSNITYLTSNPDNERIKSNQIKEACGWLSIPVIDWFSNGMVSQSFATVSGSGTEDDPYIMNPASEYTIDSLHPNDEGAKLLGLEVAKHLEYYIKFLSL